MAPLERIGSRASSLAATWPSAGRLALVLVLALGLVDSAFAAPRSSASPSASPSARSSASPSASPSPRALGPGTRVLVIGDSHTVGTYGAELDRLLRATGARVETRGSAGSSPSWWLTGRPTRCGFVARHADGSVDEPPWNAPHATPLIRDLLGPEGVDLLIVSLGANMRKASSDVIRGEVLSFLDVASRSAARIIWVGPPRTRADMDDPRAMAAFAASLRALVEPRATYIDSAAFTAYAGRDGIHYSGPDGTRVARAWARRILERILSGT